MSVESDDIKLFPCSTTAPPQKQLQESEPGSHGGAAGPFSKGVEAHTSEQQPQVATDSTCENRS